MRALRLFLLTKAFLVTSFAFGGNYKSRVEPGINAALLMPILLLSCLPEQLLANTAGLLLRHDEVESYIWSGLEPARVAGGNPLWVLLEENPRNASIAHATYTLDSRTLLLRERLVVDWPAGNWHLYKAYIIFAATLLTLQTGLILGLLHQRRKCRLANVKVAFAYDRLRMAVEAGKSLGWDWDIQSDSHSLFGDLQSVLGIPTSTLCESAEDFRRRVYPDDRQIVSTAMEKARLRKAPYAAEFRVIRYDQSVRWVSARGKFYYALNGDAVRMLGMVVDITEHKIAEEALTSWSGRLMEAQDDERKRIAREIHDDYQQRLAMIAIALEETAETCSGEACTRLRDLWDGVSELGADLHSLSHRLHSSTLERLGLVAGIKAFCEEFSDLQEIAVGFVHQNVPTGIPSSTALCLFRIVQEGLRNAKRHSGADKAEVRLELFGDDLQLTISDHGRGFDPHVASSDGGIGIRSMEERLRLLGGKMQIRSRPMQGTTVIASLPLRHEVPLAS